MTDLEHVMEYTDYDPLFPPTVGASLSNAWKQMWSNAGVLAAISIVFGVLYIPSMTSSWDMDSGGLPAYFFPMLIGSVLYSLFVLAPINYGYHYTTMKAARNDHIEVADLFEGFKNYGNAVLGTIIVGFLTILGFIFLIVPGIIVACKLIFVPQLVVDKKMSAMEAVQTSWNMTEGHTFTIFALGFVSIFIAIGGLLCFIVGIFPAAVWIQTAYGSMYHAIASSSDALQY